VTVIGFGDVMGLTTASFRKSRLALEGSRVDAAGSSDVSIRH
jgi:hypothetical protein